MSIRPWLLAGLGATAILIFSTTASSAPDRSAGPDPAISEWPGWPYRVTCRQMSFDPTAVFTGTANAERGTLGSEKGLRRLLAREFPFPLPRHHWRLAAESPRRALFLHGRLEAELESGSELQAYELGRRRGGSWGMAGYSQGWHPSTTRGRRLATTWFLAKSQPPLGPSTQRIRVDVGARCSKREDLAAQAEVPVFDEIAGKLVMTVWLRPQRATTGPLEMCGESVPPGPPLVVDLPRPLGDSELFDGGIFPPAPAMHLPEPVPVTVVKGNLG